MRSTPNKLIYIGQPLNIDEAEFVAQLDELEKACQRNDKNIRDLVRQMVPTYHPGQ